MKLYTYPEIAKLFQVEISTVRGWVHKKELELFGYRRLGKWAKEALFTEDEIKRLQYKKFAKYKISPKILP